MDLSSLLGSDAVKIMHAVSSKKRLFQDLAEMAHDCYGYDSTRVLEALMDRESLGPTGVGNGVALPHARVNGCDKIHGVFLRIEKPVDFGSVDRLPVDLIFALFAPEPSNVEHLKALALVSRTMRDKSVCAKLRANADPATLHAILTEGPASQAA
ncbi:PTS sugar transporter subunit IIA [Poseidonocella sedimentorum]|uniref:PTS IIA-like nitrogen-regulatory protein PtsN n=1 Tax=Poseidonocella sedimentorum TaxID=871652 RepID=A0A1I6D3W2_9RHOB|nr:PTS sugar transporter subunit IIA [Poseidonocella sedimentorum]SFR00188.1 PTS IIA-like nitrogen-regulatory protein PtsN [Poseidonocella sedimentorum]